MRYILFLLMTGVSLSQEVAILPTLPTLPTLPELPTLAQPTPAPTPVMIIENGKPTTIVYPLGEGVFLITR